MSDATCHSEAKPKNLVLALEDDLHCRNEILHCVQDDVSLDDVSLDDVSLDDVLMPHLFLAQ